MKPLMDGTENRAVRAFLNGYNDAGWLTAERMRAHLTRCGFEGCWPTWATADGYLTKAEVQMWIRHLISLESTSEVQRGLFENAAYTYYLKRHADGKTADRGEPPDPIDDLLRRDANGNYEVQMFNAAWWGWKTAMGVTKL